MGPTPMTLLVSLALLAGACSDSDASEPHGSGRDTTASAAPASSTPGDTAPDSSAPDDTAATTAPSEPSSPATATFEDTTCWFEPPEGQHADCGYLVVPQDRSEPTGPTVRLAVARLRHPTDDPLPDPIVYLAGGPGERIVQVLENPQAYESFAELHASGRDVILFDQRGVGYSEPTLACSLGAAYADVLDLTVDDAPISTREAGEAIAAAASDCSDALAAATDLSDFTTAESVADVEALRAALGYEQLNLWGVSYGTRLAQEVVRANPESIRSVTLDAVMPPDLELIGFVEAADRVFGQLFDGCTADAACNAAFPDLAAMLDATVTALDSDPPVIEVTNPVSGEVSEVRLTGALFSALLYEALYDTETIPFLPGVIAATANGDFGATADAVPGFFALDQIQDFGMGLSVRCNQDRVDLPSIADYDAATEPYLHLAGLIDLHLVFRPLAIACQDWDSGVADPVSWEPIVSDIPALVMTGEYDPNLAPAWGEQVASTLSNSTFFEYPGIGHGSVGTHPCPTAMFVAFVAEPGSQPDDSCMSDMGAVFETPPTGDGATGAADMQPFSDPAAGISGLAPAGWNLVEAGVWTRSNPDTDPTFLVQLALPTDGLDAALEQLLGRLGAAPLGEPVETIDVEGRTWGIFAPDSELGIVVAVATGTERSLVVAVAGAADELDDLIGTVFQPAVAALQEERA